MPGRGGTEGVASPLQSCIRWPSQPCAGETGQFNRIKAANLLYFEAQTNFISNLFRVSLGPYCSLPIRNKLINSFYLFVRQSLKLLVFMQLLAFAFNGFPFFLN